MAEPDPYDVLDVRRDASPAEVHQAWRRLCAIFHPDRHADASPAVRAEAVRRMAEVNNAYSTLSRRRVVAGLARSDHPSSLGRGADGHPARAAASLGEPTDQTAQQASRLPISRRFMWLAAVFLVLNVGGLAALGAFESDSDSDGSSPAGLESAKVREAGASPVAAPASTCPPDGEVRWITTTLDVEVLDAADSDSTTAFDIDAAGRIENRTTSTVNVKPFVDLTDDEEPAGTRTAIVSFVDSDGNGLTEPPTLQPGQSATWVLRTAVRTQRPDGSAGGPPVRAAPVPKGLTAWWGSPCAFSAIPASNVS